MSRAKRAALLTALALASLLLYAFAADQASRREVFATPTSLSRRIAGLSVFTEIKNATAPGSVRIQKKPFLFERDFHGIDTVFILSPLSPVSAREAELVAGRVRAGKKLVVSFHDDRARRNLSPLLERLGIHLPWSEDAAFRNGGTASVENDHNSSLFREGERYEFYGAGRFEGEGVGADAMDCRLSAALCYARETRVGEGTVLVISGLPPFSNGLISRAENRAVAFRLAEWSGRALFDEYHHFFSEKTAKDLWLEPRFVLPIAGFAVGAILFFLFAHTPARPRRAGAPRPHRSYHDLNREILATLLGTDDALSGAIRKHASFLKRRFPDQSGAIDAEIGAGGVAALARLLLLHQRILTRRGRNAP